jgi:hypothetical protein
MQTAHHQGNRLATLQNPALWALVTGASLAFVANLILIVNIAAGRFGSS